jgi:hypothetical protein
MRRIRGGLDRLGAVPRTAAGGAMLKPKMVVATIPVTDLERSKQFYGGTLGLVHIA